MPRTVAEERSHREIDDDRERIETVDRVLLIIEDDLVFARILLGLARDRGFKGIVALSAAQGLALARHFRPDAITLDIGLPDTDGWSLLQELKHDTATADIPVHVISGAEQWQHALDSGAVTHLKKPVTEEALTQTFDSLLGFGGGRSKNLLLVEDDITQLNAMINLIESGEVDVTAVRTAAEAMSAIGEQRYDCIVVDLGLPDLPGDELIARMRPPPTARRSDHRLHRARPDPARGDQRLASSARRSSSRTRSRPNGCSTKRSSSSIKSSRSCPRANAPPVDTALFPGPSMAGNRVLIVDDDARNIFALRSALGELRHRGAQRRERTGRHRSARRHAERRHRPDRHHDARARRVRDDPPHSRRSGDSPICRSSR